MSKPLEAGDRVTFDGVGLSARGHLVINGRSVKTGRKMKVTTPTVFVVTHKQEYAKIIAPAILKG